MRKALLAGLSVILVGGGAAVAQVAVDDSWLPGLRKAITSEKPQVKAARVDRERLTARRVDIVDGNGIIRMTLAGDLPNPIVDGIEYKRSIASGGLTLYDEKGDERGGFSFSPSRRSAQFVVDYAANDAVGVIAREDGTSELVLNSRAPEYRHPAYGNRRLPLGQGKTRLRLRLSPNGQPEVALTDGAEKTRLRLTVTEEGYGAIQFLDAEGRIVSTLAPEQDAAARRRQ